MISSDWLFRASMFILLTLSGALVFLFGSSYFHLFWTNKNKSFKTALPIAFLMLALFLYHWKPAMAYWQAAFAFFAASAANLLSTLSGAWIIHLFKIPQDNTKGMALAKLSEALVITAVIIVLFITAKIDLGSIYLQSGNLGLGLAIGVTAFAVFAVIAGRQLNSFQLGSRTLTSLLPWILVFVLSNAFMEELWFRGVFLQKFEPMIGATASLLVTSIVFTGAHIGATYLSRAERLRFLIIVFPLALAWGLTMQITGSLLGSTLFHAGGDLLIVNGFIAAFHKKSI